jgi:hypothetical protein
LPKRSIRIRANAFGKIERFVRPLKDCWGMFEKPTDKPSRDGRRLWLAKIPIALADHPMMAANQPAEIFWWTGSRAFNAQKELEEFCHGKV